MAYRDLREFIAQLKQINDLKEINTEVSSELEIAEINNRVVKKEGPALLFNNVKGFKMPVLVNAFGSPKRMALALGAETLEDLREEVTSFLKTEVPDGLVEKLKTLPKLARLASLQPKLVKDGPCKEVILKDNFSLKDIPVLMCSPDDGGRYITLPCVFTKNPNTGLNNVGMYRMQILGDKATGMHWHIHKHGAANYRIQQKAGKPLEVAVVIGPEPVVTWAASTPMPEGFYELLLAGFFNKKPIPVVKCETVDLEVPANSEIVLEGFVAPQETCLEGPFGDHTGHYSLAGQFPVFHVTCITHRKNPIYQTTITGRPPMEDFYMGDASVRVFLPLIQMQLPEVVDINLPPEGVFHNLVIVSIKKDYPWQARKVMHALWGMGQMMFSKMIVVVDADVDVHNLSDVLWRVGNNIDPKWDVTFTEGPVDVLDHSSRERHLGTKMGIDATTKLPEEGCKHGWPEPITMDKETQKLVTRRWAEYGIEI